jgi:hypothetical protein
MVVPQLVAEFDWFATTWIIPALAVGALGVTIAGGYFAVRRRRLSMPADAKTTIVETQPPAALLRAQEERRQSPRPSGPPVEVTIQNSLLVGAFCRGWVINCSLRGVCLSLREPVPIGTVLTIHATIAPDSVPWTAVQVKHCECKTDRWFAGAEFTETVPFDVLRLFGYR